MKTFAGLKWNARILGFALFQIGFFGFMWISKTVHLLYFEQHNSVQNFGASYSAMALAGYFSIFTGHFCDQWGSRRTTICGGLLYSAGLGLRCFPENLPIAIASGLIAGTGASAVLSALRVWMVSLSTEESSTRLVGVRSATSALGVGLGCAFAGVLPLIHRTGLQGPFGLRETLLVAAFGTCFLTLLYAGFTHSKFSSAKLSNSSRTSWVELAKLLVADCDLVIATTLIGITTGFYVSFISPYLPLIMKDKGLDLVSIGLSTGSFALIRFLLDPWIAHFVAKNKERSLWIFLGAEVLIALITCGFLWSVSKWAFVILLLFRSVGLGLSAISEETLWLRIYPNENLGLYFGLNQSAFFLGDFLGGLMNGWIYKRFGLDACIEIVLAIMLLNGLLFLHLIRGHRKRRDLY